MSVCPIYQVRGATGVDSSPGSSATTTHVLQTRHVTVWGYPRRNSGVTQLLPLPTREGQPPEMLRVQSSSRSLPGQSCQPHLPEGCSLLCLPGTCLHFPAQLETVQGWMELAHGYRATICSGFPRLNLSCCLEIECRWDLRSLWIPGQMTIHKVTIHKGPAWLPGKSQKEIWESGMWTTRLDPSWEGGEL